MSPEAQRIAIADACGWHDICRFNYGGRSFEAWPSHIAAKARANDAAVSGLRGYLEDERASILRGPQNVVVFSGNNRLENHPIPDYPSDLNAMHEAEKVLTEEQYGEFIARLHCIANNFRDNWRAILGAVFTPRQTRYFFSTTAAQRAEAFLCTVGKWDDSK